MKITLAVVEIEIKHLSIDLNRPAERAFIHVNTPSPVSCPGFSGSCSGHTAGRNPLRLLFIMFLHIEMEKGKPGRSAGKRKGVKDHGQSPSRAVCCRLVCTLETCGDYAPNLNLQSRSAEVRGERAAPYSLLPRGFRPLTTRGPPFATLLPILFRPGARQRLSGLPPALAPARLPQAQCACTCSQSLPSGPGNPRAPASGAPGLTLACTQR